MKRLILSIAIILSSITASYSKEHLIFTQISQNEGFTSTVNCIYKETDGDIWFGAPNGLYSFNGNALHHHQDSLLANKRIMKIATDSRGNFWILTNTGLLCRKAGERELTEMPFGSSSFMSIICDNDGVWFGSTGELFRYNHSDGQITLFSKIEDNPAFNFQHLCRLDERTLICGSHHGIVLLDTETGEISESPFEKHMAVSALLRDSSDNIWIASYNSGICMFDRTGKLLKSFNTLNSALSNNVVLCLTEKDSTIWAGTDGGGINIIDPATDKITILSHIAGDSSSLPAHSIKSIYTDDYGNVWAGSVRDGVIRISRTGMKTFKDCHIGLTSGLSNPTVLCLFQSRSSGNIWIGTDGEGLNSFNPATGKFRHYESTLKTKVVSIADYSDRELAISLYADRIWLFNKENGSKRPLETGNQELENSIRYGGGRSFNMINENNGNILIISNHIYRLDKSTGKTCRIEMKNRRNMIENFSIIGHSAEGTWLHDVKDIYLVPDGADHVELKGHTEDRIINCGSLDKDNNIWLASDTGLCRFDISDGSFTGISSSLFQKATSVLSDMRSMIWLGTDSGLFAYLPENGIFAMFGESDGASPNEYLSKPRLVADNGDVFLGGVSGLLHASSDFVIDTHEEPVLQLDEMTIDNQIIFADKGKCTIPRNSKTIKISVSSQEKDLFRQKMYRFTISKDNIYETTSPSLILHSLPEAGTYKIMASCIKRNGDWTEPVNIITIKVPQPWYKTWWFLCSCALVLSAIIATFLLSALRRKEAQLQMALKDQEQRVYEEKIHLLINVSHELRTPLTLIMAPLKRLISEMRPEQDNFETLNRVYRQSRRMKDLLNMVLDLRKMETGRDSLKVERCDYNRWLAEITEDVVNEENAEGITIKCEFDPSLTTVDFDKRKCDTIVMNILINAIKHSNKGDVITISTRLMENGMVRTSISDQGPGLGDIDRSRLFTRYYQNNNEKYGSGIGLSYSKILVELHKGKIDAENNPDKGATFWWEIPVKADGEFSSDIQARAYLNELMGYDPAEMIIVPEHDTFDTSSMKVMLIDDNKDLLEFLKEALNNDFAEVILAESGNQAMSCLAAGKLPDIIVSDVNMPDGDGYKLCKDLKSDERFSHIPLILLTARGEEQSQSDSYKIGADAFMAKPFEVDTLTELLRNLLRRKSDIRKKYLDNDDKAASDYGSNEEAFILRLNRIVGEHLSDPYLDQQLLCKELGVSRALLYSKMKAITGAGTKEYITKIRLEKAKSLIETGNMTIAEISEMTGFASQSYFSTAFKNYTGKTPSQYKNENKLNQS